MLNMEQIQEDLKGMEQKYPHLFSPIIVKNKIFKNRIMIGPAGMNNVFDVDHLPRHDSGVTYGNRAKWGASSITINETMNDRILALAHDCQIDITNPMILYPLHQQVDYIHYLNSLVSLELMHVGEWALPEMIGRTPKGPSACVLPNGNKVEEIQEEDMQFYIDGFVKAALIAKRAGFDMVMIHAGHGWLLDQFLSPLDNKRTDKYGGSIENRARFPRMVIEAVRNAIGPDMLIELRLSVTEATEGGLQPEESIAFIKMVEDLIDIVQCSAGCRRDARTRGIMHPTHFFENGCNAYLAEMVKKSGVKIPVAALGAIHDPETAERLLAEGKCDFVAMVRSVIADPMWVEKARSGHPEDIRPCLKCLHCVDTQAGRVGVSKVVAQDFSKSSRKTECSVNPEWGREHMMHFYNDDACHEHKKVVVVGGGPAGINAALKSAEKGNEVILLEKTSELGGQFKFANCNISFKKEAKKYLDYLVHQVEKSAIDVRLNVDATHDYVKSLKADAVIVAVGANPFVPPIPGADGPNVLHAVDALQVAESLPEKIVVVGGGMVGCETALHLGRLGKDVMVLEMGEDLIADGSFTERLHTLMYMDEVAKSKVNMCCTKITEEGVYAKNESGDEEFFPADKVIMATGMRPNVDVRDAFFGTAYDVVPVGDCVKVGNLVGAVRTGYDAGLRL